MPSSDSTCDFRIKRDVRIPMRDGVQLSANLFLPDAEGPFPVIFQRMPYGWSGNPLGQFFASRGYAFLIQDCRGRYDSEGEFYPFLHDAPDGYDSLEWIAAQPWSSGKVGMLGPSYLGCVQWHLAPEGSPHLKAMMPTVMPTDYWRNGYWFHGALSLALTSIWLCLEVSSRSSDMDLIPTYDMQKFFSHLPLITLDEEAGRRSQFWKDFVSHSGPSEFWSRWSMEGKWDKVTTPVWIMGGWYDYYPSEAFRQFTALREHAPTEELRRAHKVLIGPWDHILSRSTALGQIDFGAESQLDLNELALRWFDCLLKDEDDGVSHESPITIFVMGINQWRTEQEWPLARTQFTKYYLHSEGAAKTSADDGVLSAQPSVDEPPDRYVYNPRNPVPTVGGNHSICWGSVHHIIQPGPLDQSEVEARDDVLVYTTPPLEGDMEVTGPVTLTLYASSSACDTDFAAKLVDVFPDGRAMNLTEGMVRARYRESLYDAPKLIEPGQVYEFTIELHPTSNVFQKGHRIRVDVTSSNFPLWDRNPNTGHEQGMDAEMQAAQQTVFHNREYPSHIVLPVIPR